MQYHEQMDMDIFKVFKEDVKRGCIHLGFFRFVDIAGKDGCA